MLGDVAAQEVRARRALAEIHQDAATAEQSALRRHDGGRESGAAQLLEQRLVLRMERHVALGVNDPVRVPGLGGHLVLIVTFRDGPVHRRVGFDETRVHGHGQVLAFPDARVGRRRDVRADRLDHPVAQDDGALLDHVAGRNDDAHVHQGLGRLVGGKSRNGP